MVILRFAPLAKSAPDNAEQPGDQLTVWLAAQLSTQVLAVMLGVPSLQLHVALPVVGSVESVRLPVLPWLMVKADGAVQVLPATAHVVPEATVQLFATRVVTLQLSVTPPTLTVVVIAVLKDAELVRRTASVCPLVILPDVVHAPPLIDICAPVPVTETGVLVLMPLMVIAVAVVSVEGFAPVTSANVNALGVVSAGSVVTLHVSVTPPTFTVAVMAVLNEALEVRRSLNVCPF